MTNIKVHPCDCICDEQDITNSSYTSHVIGEKSNITSGGLSTNSVNKSNVTSHK